MNHINSKMKFHKNTSIDPPDTQPLKNVRWKDDKREGGRGG